MAPFRKAIGAVKDQTSIGIAKVSSNMAPDLDVAIVKATSHDEDPAEERHIREILTLTSYSPAYVSSCVATVSRRLGKTRDWIVALKVLVLVRRLLSDGAPEFQHEILYATRRGTRLLNLSDFRDEAHSSSWDHSAFVRTYALYLDQRLECLIYERKNHQSAASSSSSAPRDLDRDRDRDREFDDRYGGGNRYGSRSPYEYEDRDRRGPPQPPAPMTPLLEMKTDRILGRMHQQQQLLERFLACRPTGMAKQARLVLIALYPIVRESFQLYADICEILAVLLDRFFEMEYPDCVKSFEAYTSAAKQIDELATFYGWCKDTGVARSSEYPEVQRITDKLLETLEGFVRDRGRQPKSPERKPEPVPVEESPVLEDMNSIKALPAPEDYREPSPPPVEIPEPPKPKETGDLVDLREDNLTADDQGNRFALALFAGGANGNSAGNGNWESFGPGQGPADNGVTSAWQNPAAEKGKADWELALVEHASQLSNQKPALAGGFDPLLLNGMYDSGAVRQHVGAQMSTVGSASSVALPVPGSSKTQVLALPAPDGSMQTVGGDPFAASLSVPPPAYVQMADIEKKQHLLVQEQQLWQQYQKEGMQGQVGLAKLGQNGYYTAAAAPMMGATPMMGAAPMPYGMPMHLAGYYYAPR